MMLKYLNAKICWVCLRNFSSAHWRKIEINKRIMNPERIKSQTFADKRANKSKHIEDNEDYCSFWIFFYKLKVHFSERLKLSLMFWLSWKFCLIFKYFSKMFVTIILTDFHMFCLHLFVQDVVLQVFLLKCEITVSPVSTVNMPAQASQAQARHKQHQAKRRQNIINQAGLSQSLARPQHEIQTLITWSAFYSALSQIMLQ